MCGGVADAVVGGRVSRGASVAARPLSGQSRTAMLGVDGGGGWFEWLARLGW